jgi:5-oxoprolinase (ATP-hydrolysing)
VARIGVDVGGTFTDLVLADGDRVRVAKVPSTPADQAEGILSGVAALEVAVADLTRFAHGTTVATNTVLERDGARLALVVTDGFRDVLTIGRQDRPSLYDLGARRPPALVPRERCIEAVERIGSDGAVVTPLADDEVARVVDAVADCEPEAVAVCLLFSFLRPEHEERLATALRERLGDDVPVSVSSEVLPVFREVERGSTTALNAYVAPRMRRYLGSLATRLRDTGLAVPVEVMRSGGGTCTAAVAAEQAVDTLLSGPAAGAWGAAAVGRAVGARRLVAFDMGGTSTDVTLVPDGTPQVTADGRIGGLPFATTTTDVHTVGAGGGSIAWRDPGGALRVGPRSAGADPGPACYGRGGTEPTVTDANVVLGRLPAGTALGGSLALDVDAARAAVGRLATQLGMDVEACAAGILEVVEAQMVAALRVVSVERGHDPRDAVLVPFGGAGPLHQGPLAAELGCARVLVPPHAGVLSALGLLASPTTVDEARTRLRRLDDVAPADLADELDGLAERAGGRVSAQGVEMHDVAHAVDLRYAGQAFELPVPTTPAALRDPDPAAARRALAAAFHAAHEERYGFAQPDEPVEVVTLRVRATGPAPELPLPAWTDGGDATTARVGTTVLRRAGTDGGDLDAPVLDRARLAAGVTVPGPAVVVGVDTTVVVEPWQHAVVDEVGCLWLDGTPPAGDARRDTAAGAAVDAGDAGRVDAVTLEVVRNALVGIAEETGAALRRTASSPNIKERADCSTALFDADGRLVAQAEHIPVHLGAMPASVAAALERFAPLAPGDQVLVSDPYAGGTHLPDWTLVAPVHQPAAAPGRPDDGGDDAGGAAGGRPGRLLGYVATRAHQSDVGGAAPGSMPAGATDVLAEGLRIPPVRLVRDGALDPDLLAMLLANTRTPDERRGDLRAQVGANALGARRLVELAERLGPDLLAAAMDATRHHADRLVRTALADLPDGTWEHADALDDDGVTDTPVAIRCRLTVDGDHVRLDLTGSDPQTAGAVNAPRAVTASAAAYVLRAIAAPHAPANEGTTRALDLVTTPGTVVDPLPPASVAAGNVETSQRIVDVLLGAFAQAAPDRVPAASQGTMNNTLLGGTDPRTGTSFTYYETLAGGQGGGPDAAGDDGVHTHMTNTRNTPVEAFELAYPLRVLTTRLRDGSGGAGRHPGGDGIVRTLEVLADDVTLTLVTERRRSAPPGAGGGRDGAPGRNTLVHPDGTIEELPPKVTRRVARGTRIVVETPGGAGSGPPPVEGGGPGAQGAGWTLTRPGWCGRGQRRRWSVATPSGAISRAIASASSSRAVSTNRRTPQSAAKMVRMKLPLDLWYQEMPAPSRRSAMDSAFSSVNWPR